jgi:dTDP-4-amino-4,6-dideoxygalactose transaminase
VLIYPGILYAAINNKPMKVPFFPPDMFLHDKKTIFQCIYNAGTKNEFILKSNVDEFEKDIIKYTGAKSAIAVHSGTGAVALSLRAIGIGPGDEVITQGFCCQPVASEVINLGATPVFVDVDPLTMVMDPSQIERRITPKTKAILPAHLFSSLVDMKKVKEVADKYNLTVVEDACVQQGAIQNGVFAGLSGDIGTWSFFQMKVMGGCGEGGVVLTNNDELAERCRILRNHGQKERFYYRTVGVNSRMDEIMAGYLRYRLSNFDQVIKKRAEIAAYYHMRFSDIKDKILCPPSDVYTRHCYYMYSIKAKERDALRDFLFSNGIATHVYYPRILTEQQAFRQWQSPLDQLDQCRIASEQNLALPIYPTLSFQQAEMVADSVLKFYN